MELGSYSGRRVNFRDYAVAQPTFFTTTDAERTRFGCGASALAMLTDIPVEVISAVNGDTHFADEFMTWFLRIYGFELIQLTLCNLSAATATIRRDNVLLVSQLFRKNEGTWGIVFNYRFYHNFHSYALSPLAFLSKPILSAYAICHPSWSRVPEPGGPKKIRHKPCRCIAASHAQHTELGPATIRNP